ncbi:MAG: Spc7 kinetochore protein-domain-containing protein [Benjaminiella poitrasii]|nr:MAG: Spc7 kinetochore protein-domain-containing protein [Benjaminiella poitrasii]
MFMEEDSPDLTYRSVPNLIEETEPTVMVNNAFGSPLFEHQQSHLLNQLSESPSERRKRRPDLFGSPVIRSPLASSPIIGSSIMEDNVVENNVVENNIVENNIVESPDDRNTKEIVEGQPSSLYKKRFDISDDEDDLTEYLSSDYRKGGINIFDEDGDENRDGLKETSASVENEQAEQESQAIQNKIENDTYPIEKETNNTNTHPTDEETDEINMYLTKETKETNTRHTETETYEMNTHSIEDEIYSMESHLIEEITYNTDIRLTEKETHDVDTRLIEDEETHNVDTHPIEKEEETHNADTYPIEEETYNMDTRHTEEETYNMDTRHTEEETHNVDTRNTENEIYEMDTQPIEQDMVSEYHSSFNDDTTAESMIITQTIDYIMDESPLHPPSSPPVSPLLESLSLDPALPEPQSHTSRTENEHERFMNRFEMEDYNRNNTEENDEYRSSGGDESMQITQEVYNTNYLGGESSQPGQAFELERQESSSDMSLVDQSEDLDIRLNVKDKDYLAQAQPPKLHELVVNVPSIAESNIPLSDFLSYVGISFPEDTSFKPLRRRSTYDIDYENTATISEQAVAAASTLPQIESFQSTCKQLNGLTQDCRQIVQHLRDSINKSNPSLFHEYSEGEVPFRSEIELGLSSYKSYARLKALCDCYGRWVTMFEGLEATLKSNYEKLSEDEQSITKLENRLKNRLKDIKEYQLELQIAVDEAHIKEKKYNSVDYQQLIKLEQEIDQQYRSIQAFTDKAKQLERDDAALSEKIASLDERKIELEEIIVNAEDIIAKNKIVTLTELEDASQNFAKCSKLYNWNFKKIEEELVRIHLSQDITLVIDKEKLRNKVEDGVVIHTKDNIEEELGQLAPLLHGLDMVKKNKWDINEITQDISIYWNRVRMIQHELRNIQRRFWVEINSLDNKETDNAGFSCKICVFSYERRLKFTISIDVTQTDILKYPEINLSSIHVNMYHGELSYKQLESMVLNSISETGFETLALTIENMIAQIPIP